MTWTVAFSIMFAAFGRYGFKTFTFHLVKIMTQLGYALKAQDCFYAVLIGSRSVGHPKGCI